LDVVGYKDLITNCAYVMSHSALLKTVSWRGLVNWSVYASAIHSHGRPKYINGKSSLLYTYQWQPKPSI